MGKEFYSCSLWPSDDRCDYFHLIDNNQTNPFKVEKRRPLKRKEIETSYLINRKDMFFITPMTSKYTISKFERWIIGKYHYNVEISPLFVRENDYIDLWINDNNDNYISFKIVPLRRHWMRFDHNEFNIPTIKDEKLRGELFKIFSSYYSDYQKYENINKEKWDEEDNKLYVMLHDFGKKDNGFLYGYSNYIAFELKNNSFLIVKTEKLKSIEPKKDRIIDYLNAKFTWFKESELECIKENIKTLFS